MSATLKGLYLSLVTMFLWATHDVLFRFSAVNYHVEPVIFTCLSLFEAAIILIMIGGSGKGGINTLRQPHTWAYGVLEILLNISQMFALLYITTTEMNFLNRATIVMSLFATWLFFRRAPSKHDLLGVAAVSIGLFYIAYNIPEEVRFVALFCIFWVGITSTACAMISETHPENNKAITVKDKCRVTGYVLFVCSLLFLTFTLVLAFVKSIAPVDDVVVTSFMGGLPGLDDFLHKPTVIIAMLMGISVMPMAMYFFFYATKVAKTETFMMVSSFLPFITYAIERTFSFFGLLDIGSISSGDFIAGGLIVAGAMYMIYMRHLHKHLPAIRAMRRKAVKEEKEASKSDYSMLCDTLEFCNGSHKDTARLLGISVEEVEAVHAGEGKRKFETGTGMKIGRNYHRHVASADALTHLSKREVLMQGLNGSIRNDEPCSLLFIDLDKFKPVNDTYGHEAGNELLKLVADVLVRAAPKGAIVARIGGDEFAIMIRKPTERSVMALKSKIKKNLLSPLKLESMAEAVHIGASIGVANFPEDAQTIKELMSIADSRMYSEKEER